MTVDLFQQEPLFESGGDLAGALEALLLASGEVLDLAKLRELTGLGEGAIRQGLEMLDARLQPPRGSRLLEVGGGWRLATAPEYAELVSKLVTTIRSGKLTPAQIETLAIIAYRQPCTRGDMEDIRGVTINSLIIKQLEDRGWVETIGHRETVGRPALFATTKQFLDDLGLESLNQLPALDNPAAQLSALAQLGIEEAPQDDATTAPPNNGQEAPQNDAQGASEKSTKPETTATEATEDSDSQSLLLGDAESLEHISGTAPQASAVDTANAAEAVQAHADTVATIDAEAATASTVATGLASADHHAAGLPPHDLTPTDPTHHVTPEAKRHD